MRSYMVGNDTVTYLGIYSTASDYGSLEDILLSPLIIYLELGYLFLNWICINLFSHYQSILVVTSAIIYYGYYRFCKQYSYSLLLSFAIFFFLGFSDSCMNTIRQCIAMVITLYSYDYIVQKRKKSFFCAMLIAILFHKSAIVFIPAWWICKLKFCRKNIAISLLSSIVLLFFLMVGNYLLFSVMGGYSNYMSDDYEYSAGGKIAPLINLIMYLTICWFSNKQIKMAERRGFPIKLIEDMKRMRNLLWVAICFLILSLANALIFRMAMYYYSFILALFANAVYISKNRGLWSFIIVVFMLLYYLVTVTIRPEWNTVYPYSFFWEHPFTSN